MSNTPIYNFIQNKDFFASLYKTNDIKFRYSNGVFKIARPTNDTNFVSRLQTIMGNLPNFPWATGHMFLAGGAMNYVLDTSINTNTIAKSDMDFFILNDDKTKKIVDKLVEYLLTIDNNSYVGVTGGVITIWGAKFSRPIQIVIMDKHYKSIGDIFNTFDMPHVRCAYDGLCIYTTPDALHSIRTKKTSVNNPSDRNAGIRMYKALARGYNINGVLHSTLARHQLVKDYINKTIYKVDDYTTINTLYSVYPTMRHISKLNTYKVDQKIIDNGVSIENYIAYQFSGSWAQQIRKLDCAKPQKEIIDKACARGLSFNIRGKGNTILSNIIMEIPLENCSWNCYEDKEYKKYKIDIKTNVLFQNKLLSILKAIYEPSFGKVDWTIITNISCPTKFKQLYTSALEDIIDLGSIKAIPVADQVRKEIRFRLYAPGVYTSSEDKIVKCALEHIDWNGLNGLDEYSYSGVKSTCLCCNNPVDKCPFKEDAVDSKDNLNCPSKQYWSKPVSSNTKIVFVEKYLPKICKLNPVEKYTDVDGGCWGYAPVNTKVVLPIEPSKYNSMMNTNAKENAYGMLFHRIIDGHAGVYYYDFSITDNTRNMLYAYIIDQFNLSATGKDFKYIDGYIKYIDLFGKQKEVLVCTAVLFEQEEEHKIPVDSKNRVTLIPYINEIVTKEGHWYKYEIHFRVAK